MLKIKIRGEIVQTCAADLVLEQSAFPTCLSPVDNTWCYALARRQNMQLDKRAVCGEF